MKVIELVRKVNCIKCIRYLKLFITLFKFNRRIEEIIFKRNEEYIFFYILDYSAYAITYCSYNQWLIFKQEYLNGKINTNPKLFLISKIARTSSTNSKSPSNLLLVFLGLASITIHKASNKIRIYNEHFILTS